MFTHRNPAVLYPLFILLLFLSCFLPACNTEQEQEGSANFTVPEGLDRATEQRFRQYAVQGRALYEQHCANCHQADGTGLGTLIPPLAQSDYLQKNEEQVLCIIRYGAKGPLLVNGIEYNQPMPANPQLSNIEIAEIATYIFNSWGNSEGFVRVQEATETLQDCR